MHIITSESEIPVVHCAAVRLARRLVGIVEPCLREEERLVACRQYYTVIREFLQDFEQQRGNDHV